jgi:L-alanine-DL-glutamate epimerase-like enolase superfamily enzyme
MTKNHITPDADGLIQIPDAPGLGIEPDLVAIKRYLVDTEIIVNKKVIYRTPTL